MKTTKTLALSLLFQGFSRCCARKAILLLYPFLLVAPLVFSQLPNTWTQKADFGGTGRHSAVAFSIGGKGYLGTGYNNGTYYKDFWEYDPTANTWTQKADFGGTDRSSAVGFSIGSKGYLGTGSTYGVGETKDFWEYDPYANAWTQKSDFGGAERRGAVGFSIGSKGYLGTGSTYGVGETKDFWEYDPYANAWTQKADFGGLARRDAVGFRIGSKGYLGTGVDNTLGYYKDFWEYDPDANTWIQKANFGGTGRQLAVGFSIGSKGYLGTGYDGNQKKDFWEYEPDANTWTQKADFEGIAREQAVGFNIGSKGYLGTGYNGGSFYKDFWEYTPDEGGPTCNMPTNPFSDNITSSTATLKWDAVSGAIGYKVRYKTAGTSEWITIRSPYNIKNLSGLAASTEYAWEVKSICGMQPIVSSEWSEKKFFTTAPLRLTGEYPWQEPIQEITVEVFPNPFSTAAIISFFLNKDAHAVIELFDLAGRKLETIMNENLSAGNHEVMFHRGQLGAGIYLLQVKINDQLEVRKLMVE